MARGAIGRSEVVSPQRVAALDYEGCRRSPRSCPLWWRSSSQSDGICSSVDCGWQRCWRSAAAQVRQRHCRPTTVRIGFRAGASRLRVLRVRIRRVDQHLDGSRCRTRVFHDRDRGAASRTGSGLDTKRHLRRERRRRYRRDDEVPTYAPPSCRDWDQDIDPTTGNQIDPRNAGTRFPGLFASAVPRRI